MKTSSILYSLSRSVRSGGDLEFEAKLICRDEDGCQVGSKHAPIVDVYVESGSCFVVDITQIEKARKEKLVAEIEGMLAGYEAEYNGLKRPVDMEAFSIIHGKVLAAILKIVKDA